MRWCSTTRECTWPKRCKEERRAIFSPNVHVGGTEEHSAGNKLARTLVPDEARAASFALAIEDETKRSPHELMDAALCISDKSQSWDGAGDEWGDRQWQGRTGGGWSVGWQESGYGQGSRFYQATDTWYGANSHTSSPAGTASRGNSQRTTPAICDADAAGMEGSKLDWNNPEALTAFRRHEVKLIKTREETKKGLRSVNSLLVLAMKTANVSGRLQSLVGDVMTAKAKLDQLQTDLNWAIDYLIDFKTNNPVTEKSLGDIIAGTNSALTEVYEAGKMLRVLLPKTQAAEDE